MTRALFVPNDPISYYRKEKLTWVLPPFRYFNPGKQFSKLYVCDWGEKDETERGKNYEIVRVQKRGVVGKLLLDVPKLSKRLRGQKIDIVRAYNPNIEGLLGYLLSRRLGAPFVVSLHNAYEEGRRLEGQNIIRRMLLRTLERYVIRKADGVFCVSTYLSDYAKAVRKSDKNVYLILNKVDVDHFRKRDEERIASIKKEYRGRRMLLFIGRLTKQKNLDTLLHAVKRTRKNTVLLLVGNGEQREPLERLAQELGIADRVRFLGNIQHEELKHHLHACDAFVFPSIYEGFGIVLAEAQAAGAPIVTADIPMTTDIVNRKNSYISKPYDVAALTRNIEAALSDKRKTAEFVKRGLQHAEQFDWSVLERREAGYYQEILKGAARR